MKLDEAAQLEREFGIAFPYAYMTAITTQYPFNDWTVELDDDPESLRMTNRMHRNDNPWCFPWVNHYWCIGGDGCGGFYFIDTKQTNSTVYYCDHEEMPSSIEDVDNIGISSFCEFVIEIRKRISETDKWDREMRDRVANRKWWQFWIPRKW